jgi:copper chaperone
MSKKIRVKGMNCHHCVVAVRKVLNEIEGVQNIEVNLEKGEVTFDEIKPVGMVEIREKIEKAGYEVA